MSRAGEIVPLVIPVFNLFWWAVPRIRRRFQARRAGNPLPPVKADAVREGIERGLDMLEELEPGATPREKPPTGRGLR